MIEKIYNDIDNYYSDKLSQYGTTAKGVDWNGEESQFLRFKQLSKIINKDNFLIADIGCGYGKYCEYLENNFCNYNYLGYDLSSDMIKEAQNLYNKEFIHICNLDDIKVVDYCIASGIFSVKMKYNEAYWLSYILNTLETMNKKSLSGFSFNMLTKYSDKEYMKDNLYYADPLFIFDYCKRNFSRNISLIHDYDLYEFTILVKKD